MGDAVRHPAQVGTDDPAIAVDGVAAHALGIVDAEDRAAALHIPSPQGGAEPRELVVGREARGVAGVFRRDGRLRAPLGRLADLERDLLRRRPGDQAVQPRLDHLG